MGFPRRAVAYHPESPRRLGFTHPAALPSCFSPAPCLCPGIQPGLRLGEPRSGCTAWVCRRNQAGRPRPRPPCAPPPRPRPRPRPGNRAAGTAGAASAPKSGRRRAGSPDGRPRAGGAELFLQSLRGFACVVICDPIYGDVRKKDDIGAGGGGATI